MLREKRLDIGFAVFVSFFAIVVTIIGILITLFVNILFGPILLGLGCIIIWAAFEAWSFVKE